MIVGNSVSLIGGMDSKLEYIKKFLMQLGDKAEKIRKELWYGIRAC